MRLHYRPEVPRGFQELKVPRLRDNGPGYNNNNNNNNNNYLLQLGCYPVAVVILHVNKT